MATSTIVNLCSTETINGWTVRKYSDGQCEATRLVYKTLSSGSSLWTNQHYANSFTETLPSGVFISTQYGECEIHTYGMWGWAEATTTSVTVKYTVAAANISVSAYVLLRVVGKWK